MMVTQLAIEKPSHCFRKDGVKKHCYPSRRDAKQYLRKGENAYYCHAHEGWHIGHKRSRLSRSGLGAHVQ